MRRFKVSTTIAILALAAGAPAAYAQNVGPSTTQKPYVVPVAPGVITTSIASNGNGQFTLAGSGSLNNDNELYPKIGGGTYRFVGIPDGAGAYDNGNNTFTVLMNHELGATSGISRAHGTAGAFVSQWVINKADLSVVGGKDLITSVAPVASGAAPFGRLCSADLPAQSAFFNINTGLGTQEKIFMNGEEIGDEGRAFGTVVSSGTAHYLPDLGRFNWENSLANPFAQDKTIVLGTDDSTPGELYMYVGTKSNSANPIAAAGLNGGSLYGLKTPTFLETTATPGTGAASFVNLTPHATGTGANLQIQANAGLVTRYARPEDGAWDPAHPTDFYWVNTGSASAPNRLYRLRLSDITQPELGGTVEMLLDGTEGPITMDNMTLVNGVDGVSRLLIQEDPGGANALAKIWMYDVSTDGLLEVATHDTARFSPGGSAFLTNNEESSGIIPIWDILGEGWFLADVQAHYSIGGELVEGGQMFAMYVPQAVPEPSAAALLGLGAGALLRRRSK